MRTITAPEVLTYLSIGAVLIGVPVYIIIQHYKLEQKIKRERFERTNSSGVLEFASYEESQKFEKKEQNLAILLALGKIGAFAILVGLFFIAVPIYALTGGR